MSKSTDMYMDEQERLGNYKIDNKFTCPECKEINEQEKDDNLTDGQESEWIVGFRLCSKCAWYGQPKEILDKEEEILRSEVEGDKIHNPLKIYMAGKVNISDWRHDIIGGRRLRNHDYWDSCEDPYDNNNGKYLELDFFTYTGPFFVACDHGCSHGDSTHGAGRNNCVSKIPSKSEIFKHCIKQIKDSDYIFCWIDSLDCYGTLFELGIAHENNKKIFIGVDKKLKLNDIPICECGHDFSDRPNQVGKGCCHSGPKKQDDLWFVKQSGENNYYENHNDAWNKFLDWGPMKVSNKEKEAFVKTLNTQELEDFEDVKNKQPMSKTINYFKRNRKIVTELKKLYNGKCQICQQTFEKEDGTNYCETHHVKALGKNGTDTVDNLVVLCPTCHKKLHFAKEKEFDIKYKEEHYKLMEVEDNEGL